MLNMEIFIRIKKPVISIGLLLLLVALAIPNKTFAQVIPPGNSRIAGTIIDSASKQGLAGAVVRIKGVTNGAAADVNGNFALITAQKLPFTIVVSYVGYET